MSILLQFHTIILFVSRQLPVRNQGETEKTKETVDLRKPINITIIEIDIVPCREYF